MLLLLPQEVNSLIFKYSIQLESFKVVGKLKRLSKYLSSMVASDSSLVKCLDLSRLSLTDSSLTSLMHSLNVGFIRVVSLKGNRDVSHKTVEFIIRNTGTVLLNVQDCAKVDLFLLVQDLRQSLEASSLQKLCVLHSGEGKRYICRVSIGNLGLEERDEIIGAMKELECNLKKFNKDFLLEPGICLDCLEEMSIEFTPQCGKCKSWVKRSCGKCQSRNYRICIECLYSLCQKCDSQSNGFFMFPNCSLEICYEHHGRIELLRNLAVCGSKCKEYTRNACYNCGFWVCPRTRECHYEVGVLRSINRLIHECKMCGHGICGLCKDLQPQKRRCETCNSACIYCLENGYECLPLEFSGRICKGCVESGVDDYHNLVRTLK